MKIGGLSAQLYHKEQPKTERQQAVCSRCHRVDECQNDVTCRACSESGHTHGDPTCSCQQPADPGGVWPCRRESGAEPFRRTESAL